MLDKIITKTLIVIAAITVVMAARAPETPSFIREEAVCVKLFVKDNDFMVTLNCKKSGTITLWCEEKLWNSIKAGESYVIVYRNYHSITDQLISARK